ncbi:hypothetical protein BGZ47_002758 [Haplosporangium gracile]|nr:hypothetical protein BGZ47_002758 [Haplosporangium gracile]
MTPTMRMALVALLFAATAAANIEIVPISEQIFSAANPILATRSLPDCRVSNLDRDEANADKTFLGYSLPAVYKHDGTTIICRCTVPKTVALTYGDGSFKYADKLLDILKAKSFKATFFYKLGEYCKLEAYEGMVKRAYREGHYIASHTWSHKDLEEMSARQICKEMTALDYAIKELIGVGPKYMRPSFGSLSTTARRTLDVMMYRIAMWDIAINDWRHPTDVDKSLPLDQKSINSGHRKRGGHNVLMHGIIEKTATTLTPRVIDLIKSKGFKVVIVGECLGKPKGVWYRK